MALHSDEMMGLCHGLRAFGEIFFEEFAEQLPLTSAEHWTCLDGKFEPSLVQSWIWGFVEVVVVYVCFNLLA